MYDVNNTLTIRLDASRRRRLGRTAESLGKTVSELVREILDQALSERPLSEKAGHLKGSMSLPRTARTTWRRELRAHNWRP